VRFTVPEGHREEHTKKKMREIEKDRRKKLQELAQAKKDKMEKKNEPKGMDKDEVKEKGADDVKVKKEKETDEILIKKEEDETIKLKEESSELFLPDNVTPTMSTDCVPVPSTATILNGELPAVYAETC